MITKFKIFEALNEGKPEIGDYVICNGKNIFLKNNITKIKEIRQSNNSGDKEYHLRADDKREFSIAQINMKNYIEYWSKNREDLESILQSKKYNI